MHFALREMTRHRVPIMIWLVVSVMAGLAGPFGTLDAMEPGWRVLYWAGTTGFAILASFGARRLARDGGRLRVFAVWNLFVLVLATGLHLINAMLFDDWGGWQDWLYLITTVGVTTAAVHLLIWGVLPRGQEKPAQGEADAFQRRLPIDVRAPLVRIEAQDHYLNVVTQKGSTLILMRLGDAMAELSGLGLQVHRSHWIAVDSVTAHRREKARDVLVMADGEQVPVSRSFRKAAQDAALF